jgi:RNA-directed DNA polymerase
MNTKKVCAPSNGAFGTDIKNHESKVKNLQMRIVKALKQGRYNKVKTLQWLLTHSYSAKILAVHRVTTNKGKNTPGVDGVTWKTDKQKKEAVRDLKRRRYKAKPLRRIFIPKKNGKKRPLGIPTMMDRAQQALHLMALDPVAETILDDESYGFRQKRSTADAIEAIYKAVAANKDCAEWVLEGDIKACFDNISHEWLLDNIPMDKKILGKWLKAGIIFKDEYSDTKAGTPQGGIISPCLANLTLNGLASMLKKKFMNRKVVNGKEINNKVHTVVYADDFVITGKSKELLENEILPEVKKFMKERGLELSEEKTMITHVKDGFDFLGQNTRKYKGKILTKPAKKNLRCFLDGIRKVILDNPSITQEKIIGMLNPKIRGWMNYHRHIVAKKTFSYVDYQIYKSIWRWCRRRHDKKRKWWVSTKYFHKIGTRNWVFAAKNQKDEFVQLITTADTKIIRHTKIRKGANPYDAEWQIYFEEREGERMFEGKSGRKILKKMWSDQKGKCTLCGDEVNKTTGWKMHINDKIKKEIVHPECHRRIHPELLKTAPVEMRER